MLPKHEAAAPGSGFVGQEMVRLRTLDSMFESLCAPTERSYLKIDTQGYEKKVLDGARRALRHITTIELEMSLVPLYEGEMLFAEMHRRLEKLGYRPVGLEPGFANTESGELLQVIGIYQRIGHAARDNRDRRRRSRSTGGTGAWRSKIGQ